MKEKKCIKCNEFKSITEFYAHTKMRDGYLGKCKECAKRDAAKTRLARLDYYQEYDRKRANLPHRVKIREEVTKRWKKDPRLKRRKSELSKKWTERNLLKRAAHILVNNALRNKRLIKQPCERCGDIKSEAHHEDYSLPLDVIWFCKKHHAERHKELREAKRSKD